jgi:late competence protein required for DNA uptake (superfamily II DNA/RNA helicase)
MSHLAAAHCKRCGIAFRFYQVTKAKFYCRPCKAKERREAIRFFSSPQYQATRYQIRKERNKVAQIVG